MLVPAPRADREPSMVNFNTVLPAVPVGTPARFKVMVSRKIAAPSAPSTIKLFVGPVNVPCACEPSLPYCAVALAEPVKEFAPLLKVVVREAVSLSGPVALVLALNPPATPQVARPSVGMATP